MVARPLVLAGLLLLAATLDAAAQGTPSVTVNLGDLAEEPKSVATTIQILLLLTLLSLAPAIVLMVTSFARIVIVLSFVRQAMATPQMPPNQILIGLALFLTLFAMSPVLSQVHESAVQPYINGELGPVEALKEGVKPLRQFMLGQTREKDLALFASLARQPKPSTSADLSLSIIVPAFMTSELKTAFEMGFVVYLPFLIIDMVVASVLMSMGMLMLPPAMISLPFKILLFVLVDGWHLVMRSLMASFGAIAS